MSKMIYLTSSESADPHHLGQIRGVGRQLHHHGASLASCLLELRTSQWNIGFVTDLLAVQRPAMLKNNSLSIGGMPNGLQTRPYHYRLYTTDLTYK